MMAEETDAVLVARVQARDEAAFRVLYRRHTPRLLQLQLRFAGGRAADAEDMVQETWLRAVRGLGTFRRDGRLGAWLYGIAVNVAREWLRQAAGEAARRADVDVDDLPLPARPTADSADLEAAIARLPAGQRAVLLLHDLEGFTHEDIATALGIVAGTSKSQLALARRALRRALGGPDDQPGVRA
jgi:RNA polymerase sigma-70 factor (ECF subfamily)